ncbi:hypothetical protein CDAR_92341 [Caerostris darwini]|uniref:SOCS box domain-containing protein n=1 Tax=Caerostris darwini TaxID=1538125 RepID=A0AAV4PFS2_9ARAC|nr:hypothetical protein CDAR_92341 [Caerostris darwini]
MKSNPCIPKNYSPITRLVCARDVVRLDFVLAKTVSYLNLNLGDFSMGKEYSSFICTEEGIRKHFDDTRELMYRFNLDKATGLDSNLNVKTRTNVNGFCPSKNFSHALYLRAEDFFYKILIQLVVTAKNKQKLMRWFLNLKKNDIHILFGDTLESDTLMVELSLFSDKLKTDVFLAEISKNGAKIQEILSIRHDLISRSIHSKLFDFIPIFLKYQSEWTYRSGDYKSLKNLFRRGCYSLKFMQRLMLRKRPRGMSERRHFLLLLTLACFNSKRQLYREAAPGLQQMWRSLPDPFLAYHEMHKTLQRTLEHTELRSLYVFYKEVVGIETFALKPRSLQDLCRVTIRRTLDKNNLCLPDAIDELPIVTTFKQFLKLSDMQGPTISTETKSCCTRRKDDRVVFI